MRFCSLYGTLITYWEEIKIELLITGSNSGNIEFYAYGLNSAKFNEGYTVLDAGKLESLLMPALDDLRPTVSIRRILTDFAAENGIPL